MATPDGNPASSARRQRRMVAAVLFGVAGGMVGLAFASVPLYRLFCQITGYGGTPRVAVGGGYALATGPQREITVRFDSNINPALPWRFEPGQSSIKVRLGDSALAVFRVENLGKVALAGSATFNVTPNKAAPYFVKTQCFCFDEQHLAAGQVADLPVSFYVDPEIANDPNTRDVSTITLSYTFFPAVGGKAPPAAKRPASSTADGRQRTGDPATKG